MRRHLVVANQTLGDDQLVQAVRKRILQERSDFWVLVPATRPHRLGERSGGDPPARISVDGYDSRGSVARYGDDSGESLAQRRLDRELQRLHEAGAEADGEVGDPDPYKAVAATLKHRQFDEILVSTLPHTRSRWLRQDLPGRLKRFGIPVTHIVAT